MDKIKTGVHSPQKGKKPSLLLTSREERDLYKIWWQDATTNHFWKLCIYKVSTLYIAIIVHEICKHKSKLNFNQDSHLACQINEKSRTSTSNVTLTERQTGNEQSVTKGYPPFNPIQFMSMIQRFRITLTDWPTYVQTDRRINNRAL